MNIRFYKNFSKRKNSTKQPGVGVTYADHNCVLKNPTTIENPTITLAGHSETKTASGNPITITDAGAGSAQSLTVDMLPIQAGSGTPSPSNPRPISGRNSLDITVNDNTETISLGETVYGGTCDVVNGETSNIMAFVDLDNLNWTLGSRDRWTTADLKNLIKMVKGNSKKANIVAEQYETYTTDQLYLDTSLIGIESDIQGSIKIRNGSTTEKPHGKIAYELATPTTINTPSKTISLNKGNNTLSTSGDNMSLSYLTPGTDLNYDYVYIEDFKRYYFLRQTTILSNNHIQYELEEDSLASKKTAIGATVAHIAYAATGWDKWLIDSRLPVKTTKNINTQVAASGLSNTGMYVVAIINDRSATKLGACTFYMMTEANMNNLAYNLSDQGIITDLRNIFNNPLDSIVKAVWIPLAPTDVPQTHYDNAEVVYAGSRALNLAGHECYGAPLKDFVVELAAVSLLIPDKHQDFRDASPFTTGSLYLPGLGLTDLNMSDFIESVNVNIKTYIDITTGDITYRIYEDNGHILKTCIFNGATEIPLAHVTNNAGGTLASIGGVAGGAITAAIAGASGNLPVAFGGIATALASGTSAVMQSAMRATSIKGGIQGRSAFYDVTFKLLIVQLITEDPDDANYIATFGRPVGVTHAISNHSGYVQCDNASVVMSGSVLERDRINDYLNTGFFYE